MIKRMGREAVVAGCGRGSLEIVCGAVLSHRGDVVVGVCGS